LATENIEGYAPLCYGVKADFCLFAKGDSMIGARIYDGDLVFIRKQSMVENGEIGAILIDDSATLKRVYYYPEQNKLILNPENPKYEPLVYIGEELKDIQILGKAVSFIGKINGRNTK
jgi:repressor LexA